LRKRACLHLRPLPRRIEHHYIEMTKLITLQRAAEEVPRFSGDRFEAGRRRRGSTQSRDRCGINIKRAHACCFGKPQREGPDAAE
jgi:hypothetical protein